MTNEKLQEMLDGMERDGLIKSEMINGEKCYTVTKLGEEIVKQSKNNPSQFN